MRSLGYFCVSIRLRVLYHVTNELESPWFKCWCHIYQAVLQPPLLTGFCLLCHVSRSRTILSRATSLSPITFAPLPRALCLLPQPRLCRYCWRGAATACHAMGLFSPFNPVKCSSAFVANQIPLIVSSIHHSSREITLDRRHGLPSARCLPSRLDLCSSD